MLERTGVQKPFLGDVAPMGSLARISDNMYRSVSSILALALPIACPMV